MTRALFYIMISFIILVKLNLKYTSLLCLVPLTHYLRQILHHLRSLHLKALFLIIPKSIKNYNLIYQLEVMKFLKSIPLIL